MRVGVVIPTVTGREEYLGRCLRGYLERHNTDHQILPFTPKDLWSGGMAWQRGAEMAVDAGVDFLHFTNDDIVPGFNYLQPMIDNVAQGYVPVVLIVIPDESVLDSEMMPLADNPITPNSSHFEGEHIVQLIGTRGRTDSEYPSLPFCSRDQWAHIGPMIPTQYATDKWFGHRARAAGIQCVCEGSIFYHYAATVGRDDQVDGWLGMDRLTFDQNIAYPMYVDGTLPVNELHPEARTQIGRQRARNWYLQNVGRTYWEVS